MIAGLILAAAFVLGGLPFSPWIARLHGMDLRAHGSGNVGATNVYRILGWKPGLAALGLDVLKGAVAVALARAAFPSSGAIQALAGVAAVSGHVWSPFLGFRGGKGVATGLGVFLGLAPQPTLWTLGVWLGITLLGGWISLASMGASAFLPVAMVAAKGSLGPRFTWILAISILLAALVLWRHRTNWARLRAGTEPPLWGQPPKEVDEGMEEAPRG